MEESLIELLPSDIILLPEYLKDNLQQQCDRLSQAEKYTLSLLATKNQPISLAKLLETTETSPSALLNILQSLCRRSLIEKQENLYSLPSILKEYYTENKFTLNIV